MSNLNRQQFFYHGSDAELNEGDALEAPSTRAEQAGGSPQDYQVNGLRGSLEYDNAAVSESREAFAEDVVFVAPKPEDVSWGKNVYEVELPDPDEGMHIGPLRNPSVEGEWVTPYATVRRRVGNRQQGKQS